MNTLTTIIRSIPKRAAFFSFLGLAVIVPSVGFAWGPTRDTYTIAKPADHVTFNSITDNPNIGDERNFVGIREDGSTGSWQDKVTVQPGKTYVVRMYVHNNAAANLNLTAKDVTATINLPTTTAKSIDVFGYINSSNAKPNEVYDDATFTSADNFNLAYQSGTLRYENNHWTNGTALSEDIFTSKGQKLGYDKLDGNIKGCLQYAGYVSFKVKPQFATKTTTPPTGTTDFTATKKVSKHGANTWGDTYAAQPGETVDYMVMYRNSGTTQQDNVVLSDQLPSGMTYVAGSTKWYNAKNLSGTAASDTITTTGINVGSYAAGANAWAIFSATAPGTDAVQCGTTTLTNTGTVQTDNGTKSDTADVTVSKECTTTPPPTTTTPETPTPEVPETPTPETPETPLPSTGPAQVIGGLVGASSLGLGIHYYIASRRALRSVL